MNKLLNNIVILAKSFYGLIIYFSVSFIFNYIYKYLPQLDELYLNIYLISHEVITVGLLIFIFRKRLKRDFIDFDKNYKKYLSLGIKVWLVGIVAMLISNNIIYHLITNNIAYNQSANMLIINRFPLYSLISMIVVGPVVEEMVFRLGFKNGLKSRKLYYVLSVLIFTSLHALNGITSPLELLYFIPYGSLAIAFSYILDKTDNIFTTTVIHTMHNALTIVLISITSFL